MERPYAPDPPDTPSARLRAARHAQGKRLVDVASEAGCAVSLVSMIESGYVPGIRKRLAVGEALGASAGHFWPQDRGFS